MAKPHFALVALISIRFRRRFGHCREFQSHFFLAGKPTVSVFVILCNSVFDDAVDVLGQCCSAVGIELAFPQAENGGEQDILYKFLPIIGITDTHGYHETNPLEKAPA